MVDMPENIPQAGDPPPPKSGVVPKVSRKKTAAPASPTNLLDDEDNVKALEELLANAKAKRAKPIPKLVIPGMAGMPTMRILLEDSPDIPPSGQFIGHNGSSFLLKSGVWCDVPIPLLEVLNHAVQMQPILNDAKQVVGWREKMRYPYRVAPGQYPQAQAA